MKKEIILGNRKMFDPEKSRQRRLNQPKQILAQKREQVKKSLEADKELELSKALEGQISVFYGDEIPSYRQGAPIHELEELVTAEDVNFLVRKLEINIKINKVLREALEKISKGKRSGFQAGWIEEDGAWAIRIAEQALNKTNE